MSELLKRIPALAAALLCAMLLAAGSAWAAGTATITVGDATANPGEEVTIPVSIADNPGIAGMAFDVSLPGGVDFNSAKAADALAVGSFNADGTVITWYTTDNMTADGDLMSIAFTVPTEPGDYEVSLAVRSGKPNNITDEKYQTVPVTFVPGTLTVAGAPADKIDLASEDCYSELRQRVYLYEGDEVTPLVSVSYDGTELQWLSDYTMSLKNNDAPGTATVTLTGIGDYTGSVSFDFEILEKNADGSPFYIKDGVLTHYVGDDADVTVPNGVTAIADNAYWSDTVENITLPEGVKSVGAKAFADCHALESISLPSTLTKIGDEAFAGCSRLHAITLPASVTSIGARAFYACTGLEYITFEGKAPSFGSECFEDVMGATVTYPAGDSSWTEQLRNSVFGAGTTFKEGAAAPTATDIATCVVTLEADELAYTGAPLTPAVTVKDSGSTLKKGTDYTVSYADNTEVGTATVTVAGKGAYTGSVKLEFTIYQSGGGKDDGDFTIEDGVLVRYDGDAANVVVPEGVTAIDSSAFSGCSSLKEVKLPSTLEEIGEFAFDSCTSLAKIELPNSLKSLGYGAFGQCESLKNVTIPDSVTAIGDLAFNDCTGLTSVVLPSKLKSLGEFAFDGCTALKSVSIPATLTDIGAHAFRNCTGLEEVTFAEGLAVIGEGMFYDCEKLAAIDLPESLTSIGDNAFGGCAALTEITIPKNVASVGSYAFYGCKNVKSVTFEGGAPDFGDYCFPSNEGMAVTYPEGDSSWTKDVLGSQFDEDSVTFQEGGTTQPATVDIATCTVTLEGDGFAYTGKAITPKVTVKNGAATLKKDTDYSVAYSGNTAVGTATVTVTGMGTYTGTNTATFSITAKDLSGATVTVGSLTANGKAQTPKVTVKLGGTTLKQGTDYALSGDTSVTDEGDYSITVSGKGNYTGSVDKAFTVAAAPAKDPDPTPDPKPADKKKQKITVSGAFSKTYGDKPFSLGAKTDGDGKLSYFSSDPKVASVSSSGQVTIRGAGYAEIIISADATDAYQEAYAIVTVNVGKAANKFTAKAKKKTFAVKAAKVKKKAQAIKAGTAFKVTNPVKGKVTYKKASGNKKITVAKNGNITVKKGLKKGTYSIKVKVTCSKANYNTVNKIVTLKVKVK